MKSSTLLVILAVQAALIMGIFAAVAKENAVGESKAIDINPGQLKCCSNCNFSFSGLYTCDDIVKKCDPVCKKCAVVKTYPVKMFKCTDTFLGIGALNDGVENKLKVVAMKSSTLMVILVLQAVLGNTETNGGKLKCCSNCNFSFSGLYTCEDVVKKCDPVCKSCAVVKTHPVKKFKCTDTFLGMCGPPCKH
uniref:Bowman-Birk serine protease inhibitors family domain-containing protein n=1 Tax=Oryza rufipogon TaxID=4529 RepID=A0A0E0MQZ2_ORYRU